MTQPNRMYIYGIVCLDDIIADIQYTCHTLDIINDETALNVSNRSCINLYSFLQISIAKHCHIYLIQTHAGPPTCYNYYNLPQSISLPYSLFQMTNQSNVVLYNYIYMCVRVVVLLYMPVLTLLIYARIIMSYLCITEF